MKTASASRLSISRDRNQPAEPLWPPFLAMLALGGLYAALPPSLLGGAPRWLLAAIIAGLLVAILISHRLGNHALHQSLGYVLNSIVTAAMIFSLALLIRQVDRKSVV